MPDIKFKSLSNRYQRIPHITLLLDIVIMEEREGYIVFNGYYYVNNSQTIDNEYLSHCRFQESLPQTLEMYVDTVCYRVEFYKRVFLECTDDIANILKPDFHPTDIQRLHFRILR